MSVGLETVRIRSDLKNMFELQLEPQNVRKCSHIELMNMKQLLEDKRLALCYHTFNIVGLQLLLTPRRHLLVND